MTKNTGVLVILAVIAVLIGAGVIFFSGGDRTPPKDGPGDPLPAATQTQTQTQTQEDGVAAPESTAAQPDDPEPQAHAVIPTPLAETAIASSGTGADAESKRDKKADETPAGAQAPSFDIVRVDETGSVIVAGRAEPHAQVTLRLDDRPIGEAGANERGEWVILPQIPLNGGAHDLTVEAEGPDGQSLPSRQNVTIAMPDDQAGEPLVVVSERNRPSRTLQKPAVAPSASSASPPPSAPRPATVAETTVAETTVAETTVAETAVAEIEKPPLSATPPATGHRNAEPAQPELTLDSVDYTESGDLILSGKAASGADLRLYADNNLLGETRARPPGDWSYHGRGRLAPGRHHLRIDQLAPDGSVAARIELPFLREDPQQIAAVMQADANRGGPGSDDAPVPASDAKGAKGETASDSASLTGKESSRNKAQTVTGHIIVQPGNNLWRISRVIYGRGVLYTVIYNANKDHIRDPDLIYPGQIFATPGVTPPETISPGRRKPLTDQEMQTTSGAQTGR